MQPDWILPLDQWQPEEHPVFSEQKWGTHIGQASGLFARVAAPGSILVRLPTDTFAVLPDFLVGLVQSFVWQLGVYGFGRKVNFSGCAPDRWQDNLSLAIERIERRRDYNTKP